MQNVCGYLDPHPYEIYNKDQADMYTRELKRHFKKKK